MASLDLRAEPVEERHQHLWPTVERLAGVAGERIELVGVAGDRPGEPGVQCGERARRAVQQLLAGRFDQLVSREVELPHLAQLAAVQHRAGVDQDAEPLALRRGELRVPTPLDRVDVTQAELVQRRVPGRVAAELSGGVGASGEPAVEPVETARVVRGLVVHVRGGVDRMAGERLDLQCALGQGERIVVTLLLLAYEREQAQVEPVVPVRRGGALHERPDLGRGLGDTGERDGRERDVEEQCVGRVVGEVADQRLERRRSVAGTDHAERMHGAALAGARASDVVVGEVQVHLRVIAVAVLGGEQGDRGVPERERRVEPDGGLERRRRTGVEPQQPVDAVAVARRRVAAGGQRETGPVRRHPFLPRGLHESGLE